jgi:hypothetical protein
MPKNKEAGQPIEEEPPADLELPEETADKVRGGWSGPGDEMPQGPPIKPNRGPTR